MIYDDEPIKIDFVINEFIIKFFLYYNSETFQDVEDFNHELDCGLKSYGVLQMGRFYGRISKVQNCLNYNYVWEFISMNFNIIDRF